MVLTMEAVGIGVESSTTRSRPPARARSTCGSSRSSKMADKLHVVQVHRQERRAEARQDRDVHAEADLRRQRLRHALPPVDLEGRQAAVRRRRLRRPVARWRSTTSAASSSTRRRSRAFTNPTHQQLPPSGAGLRGAGQPGVLVAQPLGRGPHPDVLAVAQGEAHRGPLPRSDLQPLPRVLGDDDGRPRRHPEEDRPGRAARQGHLRALARGAEGRPEDAGLASRRRSTTWRRTTSSCSRATSSPRTSSRPGSTTRRRTK